MYQRTPGETALYRVKQFTAVRRKFRSDRSETALYRMKQVLIRMYLCSIFHALGVIFLIGGQRKYIYSIFILSQRHYPYYFHYIYLLSVD